MLFPSRGNYAAAATFVRCGNIALAARISKKDPERRKILRYEQSSSFSLGFPNLPSEVALIFSATNVNYRATRQDVAQ